MKRLKPVKRGPSPAYRQLWRVVDGAVMDALRTHPEYLTDRGLRSARLSLVKRITGSVIGFAAQVEKGRSGAHAPAAAAASIPVVRDDASLRSLSAARGTGALIGPWCWPVALQRAIGRLFGRS